MTPRGWAITVAIVLIALADIASAWVMGVLLIWPIDVAMPSDSLVKSAIAITYGAACVAAVAAPFWTPPRLAVRLLLGAAPALTMLSLLVFVVIAFPT